MKHLLNDLTEKEKNSIREQHTGGMKVVTENFSKLINTKSGNVKPLVNEREGLDIDDYFLNGNARMMPFEDKIFDLVNSSYAIQYNMQGQGPSLCFMIVPKRWIVCGLLCQKYWHILAN